MSIKNDFLKEIRELGVVSGISNVWKRFVISYACALSNICDFTHYKEREELYLKQVTNTEDMNKLANLAGSLFLELTDNPFQDFLGELYCELGLQSKSLGQIFTPYYISHLMAEINLGDSNIDTAIKEKGYITVNDPCCGSGVMLIAAAEALQSRGYDYSKDALFVAQDVDQTVALMCYLQLSIIGCAGYVVVGNSFENSIAGSILNPIERNSDIWFTPAFWNNIWLERRLSDETI